MLDFTNKLVLITGASSGLGAATALYFSKLSATLVLVGRKENNLKKIALNCEEAKGIKPLIIIADLAKDCDIDRIVTEAIDVFGKIDVLVNNAGIVLKGGLKESTMETYDCLMAVNLRAVYYLTKLCTPHLIQSKGCIVNVSSMLSTVPNTVFLGYSMSKAALDHFTRCVALELGPDGVRVNCVSPGYIETNILKDAGFTDDELEKHAKETIKQTPLRRLTEGVDIAALIAFFASDNAKSITGNCTIVDGGSSLN